MTISLPMCAIDFGSSSMDEEEQALADAIQSIKTELGEDLLILGHHYQRDQIVIHADLLGDSFLLSKLASESDAKFVIFQFYTLKLKYPIRQIMFLLRKC